MSEPTMSEPTIETEDYARLTQKMDDLRVAQQRFELENEVRFELGNAIQQLQQQYLGLRNRLAVLRDTDPDMFEYITKLELINGGIVCTKCQSIKEIPSVNGVKIGAAVMIDYAAKTESMTAQFAIQLDETKARFESMQRQFHNDILRLEEQLRTLRARTCDSTQLQPQIQPHVQVQPQIQPQVEAQLYMPEINLDWSTGKIIRTGVTTDVTTGCQPTESTTTDTTSTDTANPELIATFERMAAKKYGLDDYYLRSTEQLDAMSAADLI